MAIPRARGGTPSSIRSPAMEISPAVGVSSPAIIRMRVVFPQPEGPSSTRSSPSLTSRSTPSTAWTSPKCLCRSRISTYPMSAAAPATPRGAPGPPDAPLWSFAQLLALLVLAAASDEPRPAPLVVDVLSPAAGFLNGLFRSELSCCRLGEHVGGHAGVEDLSLGRVGHPGPADVGGPLQGVGQDLQLIGRKRTEPVPADLPLDPLQALGGFLRRRGILFGRRPHVGGEVVQLAAPC